MYIGETTHKEAYMATGIPKNKTLVLQRAQGKHILTVYAVGPFLEVYLGDIIIGKVRSKATVLPSEDCDMTECLRLPNYVVLLTDAEIVEINAALR
jgi:hypothetical protein